MGNVRCISVTFGTFGKKSEKLLAAQTWQHLFESIQREAHKTKCGNTKKERVWRCDRRPSWFLETHKRTWGMISASVTIACTLEGRRSRPEVSVRARSTSHSSRLSQPSTRAPFRTACHAFSSSPVSVLRVGNYCRADTKTGRGSRVRPTLAHLAHFSGTSTEAWLLRNDEGKK